MSGLEVAGVVLGAFPLIVSGLEHWRDVAKVGGFFWRVRKEYTKCQRDVQFYEIVYRRNLKELLLPIVLDADQVGVLVADPNGEGWSSEVLQERLEERLQESYRVYKETITEMNEVAEELKKELSFDKSSVQGKLAPSQQKKPSPQATSKPSRLSAAKNKLDYEMFRTKFSLGERVRNELFDRLKECNERLEKLLSSSDKVSALENSAPGHSRKTSALETAFKKAWKQSDLLFKALHSAWKCPCQQYHFANLRLEHRTLHDVCFEVILMFVAPSNHGDTRWSWREMHCGRMLRCSVPQKTMQPPEACKAAEAPGAMVRPKKVAFHPPTPSIPPVRPTPSIEVDMCVDHDIQLCQLLGEGECGKCMGIIGHDDGAYHLHPFTRRRQAANDAPVTLGHVLALDFEGHYLSRRQRYSIALLVASSVAQLQYTPWLRSGMTKDDIIFFPLGHDNLDIPYGEPFIRQGFPHPHRTSIDAEAAECNFYSLGILLLELCFGRRLEDHPLRKKHPTGNAEVKQAFDVMAALKWSTSVSGEGGDDYAAAVKWCFTGAADKETNWRGEIIRNVVRPLELCQEHFKTAG